jgi:hypothetical protein
VMTVLAFSALVARRGAGTRVLRWRAR